MSMLPAPPKFRKLIMSPEDFTAAARTITATLSGHAAHRAFDLLTNDLLRALGYGDGVAAFEAAVLHWHDAAHPYPHIGPCPDCEAATPLRAAA